MDEEQKKKIALFRFGVIAELVGRKDIRRGEREKQIRELAKKQWEIPGSECTYVSRSIIREWLRRYEESGRRIESLFSKDRSDAGNSRCSDGEIELSLVNLKKGHPKVSLPVLLKMAQKEEVLPVDFRASSQSIYRIFQCHGVNKLARTPEDRRRFEVEFANDLWQADFDSKALLPVVLCGQTHLIDKLLHHTSRPFASRVLGKSHLPELKRSDMQGYLNQHLEMAGIEVPITWPRERCGRQPERILR